MFKPNIMKLEVPHSETRSTGYFVADWNDLSCKQLTSNRSKKFKNFSYIYTHTLMMTLGCWYIFPHAFSKKDTHLSQYCYVAYADLECSILLPLPFQFWSFRLVSPHLPSKWTVWKQFLKSEARLRGWKDRQFSSEVLEDLKFKLNPASGSQVFTNKSVSMRVPLIPLLVCSVNLLLLAFLTWDSVSESPREVALNCSFHSETSVGVLLSCLPFCYSKNPTLGFNIVGKHLPQEKWKNS